MKKAVSVLFAFLLLASYSCKEQPDYEKEKAAIMAVIEEETAAYYASDFDRWSETYLNDSTMVTIHASKPDYRYFSGWESYASRLKPMITGEKVQALEKKTPLNVKIYGEYAWVVFDNKVYNERNEVVESAIVTNFLEKHDGKWKIANRNTLWTYEYAQAEEMQLNAINYAKSTGKGVAQFAEFTGDQFKMGWNKAGGYKTCSDAIMYYWRIVVPMGDFRIKEQDDNHVVFAADNMFSRLRQTPRYNVTYDDYITFYRIVFERIAEYMNCSYKQEITPTGVLVTVAKK